MTPISRRVFIQAFVGLTLASHRILAEAASSKTLGAQNVERLQLSRNSWVPNNEHLPVLLYRQAFTGQDPLPTDTVENQFEKTGWPPQWVASIYDFHHYHSTAHEVLGCVSDSAKLMLGGPNGHEVMFKAGDVALLPTGTGHCNLDSSEDFQVVGAYPPDQHWDICREAPSQKAILRMAKLPFPHSDPVTGDRGALLREWV